jgi:hypothetical protein
MLRRWRPKRWSYLAEALSFVAFLLAYIWKLQSQSPRTWWLILAWLLISFAARRDTPKTLGWRADNLWPATRQAAPFFAASSLALCAAGLFLGMLHRLPTHLIEPRRFEGYLAFCLLQQVGLNSYLMNRLLSAFDNPLPAATVAGTLFAALHWPNPVLVPLTLLGGTAMAALFAKQRNILPLTLVQAVLGALVWWAFPIAWHHSLRVGPGYHLFHL